ncbi:flagellar biosynthesis protein FlgF [Oleiphilus sp. HI0009]|uniref:flagellar basal-body rod protein FlgF n=1 Tax=unclassified Oleiphilus TaxID=2631174 RepID=UPI0007C2A99D|nr:MULTISPECIES: flagellar basal-body rod protein FlgF [unclassified Oleiphilus]KZX82366.1 flagellar biosynthesis protein FlgF [Oleiphilus sp. HI0009]KZY64318.1 flagellar biosynthesis protein FlgF [Oleiphilus sp. HI0066]KZY74455.1 flagellar biosynthesis protein FlgF [Oleiphilus sp. HI0067]
MDKALYIAMSGAKQNMYAQRAHSNNLANVNTTGFKEDFAQARAMSVYGEHFPSRAYSMTERPATRFEQGPLQETGNALDIALKGEGWIAVQSPDGEQAFTRAGDLQIDVNGFLRTGSGLEVLGEGGPIVVPPSAGVEIGVDGAISVIPLGGEAAVVQIDRIRLVNPDPANMEKRGDGLMYVKDGIEPPLDETIHVESGFLEGSNVNAVSALTEILTLSRQYELQVKLMSQADQNSEASARLLQFS